MTSHSVCRAWAPVFSSILHRQDICQKEAATGTHCHVDDPVKVKEGGITSHIYAYLRAMEREGTWYAVDAWITDLSGRERLAESTFLVPAMEPELDIENYTWEWDMLLRMFVVCCVQPEAASNVAIIGTVNEEHERDSGSGGQTVEGSGNGEDHYRDTDILIDRESRASQEEPAMDRERIDALLKPENFNWADEDDDEVSEETLHSQSQVETDAEPIRVNIPGGPLIVDSSQIRCQTPEPGQESQTREDEDPFPVPHVEESEDQMLRANVEAEFSYRDQMTAWASTTGWNIHHFNWFGEAVYEYSDTPPAVSLWYIVSEPKVSRLYDEMRVQAILTRALKFIDPVIYYGRDWRDMRRRGQDFIRAVTGNVFKCYTLHGMWREDQNHFDEGTRIDEGIMESYGTEEYVIANGFTVHSAVMNRAERANAQKSLFERQRSIDPWRHSSIVRQSRIYALSPLRSCTNVDEKWDDEDEIVNNTPAIDHGLYTITEELGERNGTAVSSARGIVAHTERPYLQVENISGSTSAGDLENNQVLNNYLSSSLQVVPGDHKCPPDPHNVPRGRVRSKFHSLPKLVTPFSSVAASLDSSEEKMVRQENSDVDPDNDADARGVSKQVMVEKQNPVSGVLQAKKLESPPDPHNIPRVRERLKCHNLPKLITPFSFLPAVVSPAVVSPAIVSPAIDPKDVHSHDQGGHDSLAEVPGLVSPQRECKPVLSSSTGTVNDTELVGSTSENPVQTEGGQPITKWSGDGLEEDVKSTQSRQHKPRLSWKRFAGHIGRVFGTETSAEAAKVRPGQKLQNTPSTPGAKSPSKSKPHHYIRRAVDSILERLFVSC
ncbi:hypothetical protein DTO021C3_601 [Paecilomyces variotii]|nr:hypothetical protein DTO021C3_601 [Paecilomyces variotii]